MQKNIIIILVFAIVIALFAILNAEAIPVNLIVTELEISAALVILISAALGAIIMYFFDIVSKGKLKKESKAAAQEAERMKTENEAFKLSLGKKDEEITDLKKQVEVYMKERGE